jgi:hypothetical protein
MDTLKEAADVMEQVIDSPDTAEIPEVDETPGQPRRIKRSLKTRDVKRLMRTFGKVREMQAHKSQARYNVARAEAKRLGIEIDDVELEVPNFDFATLLMTEGTEPVLRELNMLFADLCDIKPKVSAGASKWEIEDAVNTQIEDEDLDFYSDVLEDLNEFGGLERFLRVLIQSIRKMDSTQQPSGSA